jgi:hypothetical protein
MLGKIAVSWWDIPQEAPLYQSNGGYIFEKQRPWATRAVVFDAYQASQNMHGLLKTWDAEAHSPCTPTPLPPSVSTRRRKKKTKNTAPIRQVKDPLHIVNPSPFYVSYSVQQVPEGGQVRTVVESSGDYPGSDSHKASIQKECADVLFDKN